MIPTLGKPRLVELLTLTLLLFLGVPVATALELPDPDLLENQNTPGRQSLTVVEPHEVAIETTVAYAGLPMNGLLTYWFGDRWRDPDTEVVFLARDGYRSAIASERFSQHEALLAFRRSDGSAFEVNNPRQHQRQISLGPYYLVWNNRNDPVIRADGAYGWPYQVTRIELRNTREDKALLPPNPSPVIAGGFLEAKAYCLTCHHIRGQGGTKYPVDMVQASCGWQDSDLKDWIDQPDRLRTGTSMPPLNPGLPAVRRAEVIDKIVAYMRALREEYPGSCAGTSR